MAQAMQGRGTQHRHRRDTYHHGDLPNALADAATEMARAGGPDAVVLRAAARAAGVSAAAAYRHFADHDELLYVVRLRALDELADAMQRSLEAGEPLADPAQEALRRLRALGRAYIGFALTDPGLFRTAFCRPEKPVAAPGLPAGPALPSEPVLPAAAERMSAHGPYALLSGVLDELVQCGVLEPGRRAGAEIPAWAAVHGLATLLIDGPLALLSPQEQLDAAERCSDFVLNGIRGSR
ncbi:MAG TPA: TetR-like C-terminal domain-containing protein [Streptosporangiaceae bacterium]